jgi:hypothetical protein
MKYNKPQIAHVEAAVAVIESTQPKQSGSIDNRGQLNLVTVSAYEADE